MKLVIKGNESKVKRLAKELNLRLKRDGLESSIETEKPKKPVEAIEVNKAETVKPKTKNSKK